MRSVAAIIAGLAVAAVVFQVGAILALLIVHGIPLGASPRPSPTYFVLNFGAAALGAGLGGMLAARLGPAHPLANATVLAIAVALVALWGFTGESSQWPRWYSASLAVVAATAAIAGGALGRGHRLGSTPRTASTSR